MKLTFLPTTPGSEWHGKYTLPPTHVLHLDGSYYPTWVVTSRLGAVIQLFARDHNVAELALLQSYLEPLCHPDLPDTVDLTEILTLLELLR